MFLRTAVRNVDFSLTGIQIITVSGIYQMTVLLPRSPGNLIATVYSDSLFIRPVRNELRNVDFSCADMASYPVVGKDTFSLRWSGLFKATKTALYVTSVLPMYHKGSWCNSVAGTHFKDTCTLVWHCLKSWSQTRTIVTRFLPCECAVVSLWQHQ